MVISFSSRFYQHWNKASAGAAAIGWLAHVSQAERVNVNGHAAVETRLEPLLRVGNPTVGGAATNVSEDLVEGLEPVAQLRGLSPEDRVLGLDLEEVTGWDVDPLEDLVVYAPEVGGPWAQVV